TSWPLRGKYRVTHVVTDQWGRADSLSQDVTVDPDVARIDVIPSAVEIGALGDSLQLSAVARDPAGNAVSDVDFAWTSSDTTVAAVSATGLVSSRANGVAQVSAAALGRTGMAVITVRQKVVRLVVTPASLRFGTLGRTATITARAEDSRGALVAGTVVDWSSLDSTVASVNATGLVTARREGSTSIRAAVGSITSTVSVVVAPVVASIDLTPATATLTAATDSVLLSAVPRDSLGAPVVGVAIAPKVDRDGYALPMPEADAAAALALIAGMEAV
ncbi:MAG: Ig-like domain-containing protein, partial [Elusimicrobiota bacterium]